MATNTTHDIMTAVDRVVTELHSAMSKFGPFASGHEGYAIILEELDELWHEVKSGTTERQQEEAIQVAAMAIRYLIDID